MTSTEFPNPPETFKPGPVSPRWQALVLLLVVFLLGIATGVGGGGLWLSHRMRAALASPGEADGPAIVLIERVKSRLERKLSLTAEERSAMNEEFDRATAQFKQLRADAFGTVQELVRNTAGRIEQQLPPEKRPALRAEAEKALNPWGLSVEESRPEAEESR